MSDLTQNSWVGMPRLVANSLHKHTSARCFALQYISFQSSMCPGTAVATSTDEFKFLAQDLISLSLPNSFSGSMLFDWGAAKADALI